MNCPTCGEKTGVIDSRDVKSPRHPSAPTMESVRRRRYCAQGHRFTTYENIVDEGWEAAAHSMEERIETLERYIRGKLADRAGEWIDAARIILGVRQEDICSSIGIERSNLSHMIHTPNLKPDTVMAFEQALRKMAVDAIDKLGIGDGGGK